MPETFDYLIVGQGLAGSLLALELIKSGAKIMIIDNPEGPSASKVAAGIYNPITGKRYVKTWLCDEIYPKINPYYQSIEQLLGIKILHNTPIIRPIDSIKEQNILISLADAPENEPYIEFKPQIAEVSGSTTINHGLLATKIGGWVNVPKLLAYLKIYLKEKSKYQEKVFNYSKVEHNINFAKYENNNFKKIIFCEGASAMQNPYFNWLPFNTVKGEVLDIKMEAPLKNYILLNGIFLVPTTQNEYKVGATYNWADISCIITEEGRNEIETKLKKIIKNDFEILHQSAGIRPATVDRRPFLGTHPTYSNMAIFNGLGTKGVSIGPYFAKQMTNYLINSVPFQSDVNINRFSSLYLSSEN
jgi:glycine/D-amino acid oxidase-like deaminating enzyme